MTRDKGPTPEYWKERGVIPGRWAWGDSAAKSLKWGEKEFTAFMDSTWKRTMDCQSVLMNLAQEHDR